MRRDRSWDERAQDRLLVQEPAEKKETEPGKVHYIRAGTIHFKDKPAVLSRVMWPQTLCDFMGIVFVSHLPLELCAFDIKRSYFISW